MDRISEISKTQGFLFKYFEAPIPIPTEIKVDFPVVVGAPSLQAHLLLSKNNLSLHIHVFHFVVKSDFFWVADGLGSGSGEIPIGSRQTIFDQFLVQPMQLELDRKNSSRLKIFVPGNVAHFLQEIPHSIHISCNRDFAENYMKEHGAKYSIEDREKSDTKARFALRHTKQILENSLVSAWACAGTLLGKLQVTSKCWKLDKFERYAENKNYCFQAGTANAAQSRTLTTWTFVPFQPSHRTKFCKKQFGQPEAQKPLSFSGNLVFLQLDSNSLSDSFPSQRQEIVFRLTSSSSTQEVCNQLMTMSTRSLGLRTGLPRTST
jgi:hypothetical protein